MKKYVLIAIMAVLAWMAQPTRGQAVVYGDSNYMSYQTIPSPPYACRGNNPVYATYLQARDTIFTNRVEFGHIFHTDSVEHIYGIAFNADTVLTYTRKRDETVSVMLYLYCVPRNTSDPMLLDSVVLSVNMPCKEFVYVSLDTDSFSGVQILRYDTIPVFERLFSREYTISPGDSVLVTQARLPALVPYRYDICMIYYEWMIHNSTHEMAWRHFDDEDGKYFSDWGGGNPGPLYPIRHRACPKVAELRVDSVNGNTVWLSWPPVDSATHYRLEYGPEGFQFGGGIYSDGIAVEDISDTTIVVRGLSASTVYTFYVSAYCHTMIQYGMSASATVLTNDNASCPAVSNFRQEGAVPHGVRLAWDTVAGQQEFEILLKKGGDPTEVHISPDSNPYELTGLEDSVHYYVWLRAKCRHECAIHDTLLWGPWSYALRVYPSGMGIGSGTEEGQPIVLVPNPAHGQVTVVVNDASILKRGGQISVTDASGREVQRHELAPHTGSVRLDLSALPQGTYFVTLRTEEGTSTKKLVVK